MNPFSTYSTIPWECFRVGYNFLTWYDADFKPVPDLATEVPSVENGGITQDGKVWTFHIRPNVKWSDGQPLTARDVAYTYNRILRQEIGMYIGYFPNVTKVEAPDDQTVVITSKKPSAVMTALYVPILPEHIWKDVPDNKSESWPNVPMVSSGPFHVTEVKNGKYVKMEKNEYYKDGFGVDPAVDQVFFNMYQTQDGVVADYKAGNLDAAIELDPGFFQSLKSVPGSTSVAAPGLGFHELGMNSYDSPKSKGNKLLLDKNIRIAIDYAVDKEGIASIAMAGLAQPASSLLSPVDTFFRWEVPADQLRTYDPEKAKAILDEAGYKVGADGIREDAKGNKLKFRLAAFNEYPMDITAAKKITSYLKDVGIGTELQVMDENAFYDLNYDNADNDLYIWSWTADIDPGYILEHVHDRPDPERQRLGVLQPAVRRALHRAVRGGRPGAAAAARPGDAADPVRRRALLHPLVQHARPGLPHRHLDRVQPRAQDPGRRRLPQHAQGHLREPEAGDGDGDRRRERRQHRRHRGRHRGGRGRRRDRRVRAGAAASQERRGVTR